MPFRSFIAIELENSIKVELEHLIRKLQDDGLGDPSIKWVKPKNMHLTLKFLGDVDDQAVLPLCNKISDLAGHFDPFEMEISGLGCFPAAGPARVLWCGITQGGEDLQALAEAVDIGANELGFDRDGKRFHPHLTLARIKSSKSGHAIREYLENAKESVRIRGRQTVSSIALIDSDLTRSGPIYTPMHHASLG
jgi:2'-5' RNA ligase